MIFFRRAVIDGRSTKTQIIIKKSTKEKRREKEKKGEKNDFDFFLFFFFVCTRPERDYSPFDGKKESCRFDPAAGFSGRSGLSLAGATVLWKSDEPKSSTEPSAASVQGVSSFGVDNASGVCGGDVVSLP